MRLFAPAKVNLALHVTGKRPDGYHLLDSLVVFVDIGDWLEVTPAAEISLAVSGPRADGVPTGPDNLVWRAAEHLGQPARIHLEKHLPHAGGIGGGSSDAAAVIRGFGGDATRSIALGADLPVCVAAHPARMRGIGDQVEVVPPLPPLWAVLANPGVEVPTAAVFSGLRDVSNSPLPEMGWPDAPAFFQWLARTRNDLEPAAIGLAPIIGDVITALAASEGCLFARMSGSGATCFGLFGTEAAARAAVAALPGGWWAEAGAVLTSTPTARKD